MPSDRLFLDTSFVQARFNRRDRYHERAMSFDHRLHACREIWTTEAVLLEIGAVFRKPRVKDVLSIVWTQFRTEAPFHLASILGSLFERGVELFGNRPDKAWSLADCLSFLVMNEQRLTEALTCDHHFIQAGFRALLLEP